MGDLRWGGRTGTGGADPALGLHLTWGLHPRLEECRPPVAGSGRHARGSMRAWEAGLLGEGRGPKCGP